MEKQAAEERKRQWQWQATDVYDRAFNTKSCLTASFWPCGIYSRTSQRLKAALSGHDTEVVPDRGCCNPDCVQFALCLPLYGSLLAKLQTTVRTFYGIDGHEYSDWIDGCCCPCLTVVRNEQEILLREKQHKRLKERHVQERSVTSQYQSHTPMTYLSPATIRTGSDRVEASMSNQGVHGAVPRQAAEHSSKSDAVTSENTNAYPQVHYLDHH
ncbi:hypothetical protein QQS21_010181 [Conoideocrella luteorostrata]|uniref:Uncharacterized protein n=1 Tax=Conoideocrella luteorostrata TaxID=1105319 RepID=A0AAJ0FX42_9HYPO|nr:hypothetical protein QQS21_010181 [Conoideocrella luteorostrata]